MKFVFLLIILLAIKSLICYYITMKEVMPMGKKEKPPEKVATGLAVVALILQIVDKLLDIALKLVKN